MLKCGSFVLSFVALSIVLSGVFSSTVGAVSQWDNLINVGETLKLGKEGYCLGEQDISNTYISIIENSDNWRFSHMDEEYIDHINRYKNAVSADNPRAIIQNYTNFTGSGAQFGVTMLWSESATALEWGSSGGGSNNYVMVPYGTYDWFEIYVDGCDIVVDISSGGNNFFGSTISAQAPENIFLSTYDPNYPPNYEGEIIPDTWMPPEPPLPPQEIRPDFSLQVNNKNIKAKDYDKAMPSIEPTEAGYYFKQWHIVWNLFKCPGDWDSLVGHCTDSGAELTYTINNPLTDPFEYDTEEYGDYFLDASYYQQICYAYNPGDQPEDHYCYMQPANGIDQDIYEFLTTRLYVKIDGSSYTKDTTQLKCDVSGTCRNPLELCHEIDGFFERVQCDTESRFSIGVLNPSILAFKDLIGGMIVPSNPTCTIELPDISIAGASFPFSGLGESACTNSATFRQAFPLSTVVVNGAFALLAVSILGSIVNRMFSKDDTDIVVGVTK